MQRANERREQTNALLEGTSVGRGERRREAIEGKTKGKEKTASGNRPTAHCQYDVPERRHIWPKPLAGNTSSALAAVFRLCEMTGGTT